MNDSFPGGPKPHYSSGAAGRRLFLKGILAAICLWVLSSVPSYAFQAVHDLTVTLVPEDAALSGSDRIRLTDGPPEQVTFGLDSAVRILSLEVNGRSRTPSRTPSGIVVPLTAAERETVVEVVVRYAGRFQDEAPVRPVNTDNPGYGVSGTISPRGTLLLAGAGWYPAVANADERLRLQVIAPQGITAVTAGRATGVSTRDGKSVSTWEIDRPVGRLALSAGRYHITESNAGNTPTATYFLSEAPQLARTYLKATADYLGLYENRFGPYPFAKFAVVENFFPTGYGFPSYTLIGGRVLRLPFIVETSLGHEIAHCWWGNGVRVDGSGGNWSEGLTTYVAEHLYQELASAQAARDYRRQLLRNYATLVPPGEGFPLRRFSHRFNPLTKVIGYDKSAMVFHMLRQTIGDDAFWGGLRRLYANRLHRETRWDDLRQAFEQESGKDLGWFFRQWLDRAGAPELWLETIRATPLADGRTRVEGVLRQREPFYRLALPLGLSSGASQTIEKIAIAGRAAPFVLTVDGDPVRLEGDPHNHVFRRLDAEEIPPSVNALKGSAPLMVVVPGEAVSTEDRRAAEILAQGLGRDGLVFRRENDLDFDKDGAGDLLVLGRPEQPWLRKAIDATMTLGPEGFELNGASYDAGRTAFFGVWRHPHFDRHVMAVWVHGSDRHRDAVARKIPHYGRYSYLAFEDAANRAKGLWETAASPLVHTWPKADDQQ